MFAGLRLGYQRQWTKLLHSRSMHYAPRRGNKVTVAMSGGVDSSVTARLLAEQDYDLSAVFMRNWDTRDESGTDKGCEWEKDWEDVQRVCKMLDIPCEMIDLSREYWTRVFEPSLHLWERGETPNPDIWCNREIKFGALIDQLSSRTQWLATGHYAGVEWVETQAGRRPRLCRALDYTKDQTYYLSAISESALAKAIFPLHKLTKMRVRELAKQYGLPTASRAESMGICFVGEKRRFDSFLADYIPAKEGSVVNIETNQRVGTHRGLWNYTIGQNARIPGMPHKLYVADKVFERNEVLAAPELHPSLYSHGVMTRDFSWSWADSPPAGIDSPNGLSLGLQIRHRMHEIDCKVRRRLDGQIEIIFDEKLHGVSPGQVAVLYQGQYCIGSGTISKTIGSTVLDCIDHEATAFRSI